MGDIAACCTREPGSRAWTAGRRWCSEPAFRSDVGRGRQAVFVDLGHLDPARLTRGEATLAGGAFATRNFRTRSSCAAAGDADARVLHAVQQAGDALRLSGL